MPASDGLRWRKSSYSGGDDKCVEVAALLDGSKLVRDTKAGASSPVLSVSPTEWDAFLTSVRRDEFGA